MQGEVDAPVFAHPEPAAGELPLGPPEGEGDERHNALGFEHDSGRGLEPAEAVEGEGAGVVDYLGATLGGKLGVLRQAAQDFAHEGVDDEAGDHHVVDLQHRLLVAEPPPVG